jgi:ketose-bisphosphate aldolases
MLAEAKRGGYAVAALNFENYEMAEAIALASKRTGLSVIFQTTAPTAMYLGIETAAGIIKGLCSITGINAALHLDHGPTVEAAVSAAAGGYTSVMIDGSKLALLDNTAITRQGRLAVPGVQLEGELGGVGGKEDAVLGITAYTDAGEAAEFVAATGVDSLAIGVGTAHGFYKDTPAIKYDIIEAVAAMVSVPLVLHGASGLSDEVIRNCIKCGISKVNFATELRTCFSTALRRELVKDEKAFDPKKYLSPVITELSELIEKKLLLCAST